MSDFFSKLKKTITRGAAESASKMEEVAKAGKLRLEILNENRKLTAAYESLGKHVYEKLEGQGFQSLQDDELFAEKLGKIKVFEAELKRLRSQVDESAESDIETEIEADGSQKKD